MNSKSGVNAQSGINSDANEGGIMGTFHDLSEGLSTFVDKNVHDIEQRLSQVAGELDEDTAVNIAAGALAALGVGLGATVSKKWFILPALVGGLYAANKMTNGDLLHPVLGQLGLRTRDSIDGERSQLEGLRNDYSGVGRSSAGNMGGTGGGNSGFAGGQSMASGTVSQGDNEPERFHNPLSGGSAQHSRNHQNREEHISSRHGRIASDDRPPRR
jgi:hypothetical protein